MADGEVFDIHNLKTDVLPSQERPRERILTTFQMIHEVPGDQPELINISHRCNPEHSVQTYKRRMILAAGTRFKLDKGWFKPEQIGTVVIQNLAGVNLLVNPSEEEQEKLKETILKVHLDESLDCFCLYIRAGRVFIGEFANIDSVYLYAETYETPIRYTIFPR